MYKIEGKHPVKNRSWRASEESYIHQADKQSRIAIHNNSNADDYLFFARITFRKSFYNQKNGIRWNYKEIRSHQKMYASWSRKLKRNGMRILWSREIECVSGWMHYHLIVLRPDPKLYHRYILDDKTHKNTSLLNAIKVLIIKCIPNNYRRAKKYIYYLQIKSFKSAIRYIYKAKTKGKDTLDKWEDKRNLWHMTKMRKIGTIGKVFNKTKKELWQEIINITKQWAITKKENHENI